MSSDLTPLLFQAEKDSGASERDSAMPALNTWVTPKVITATLEDTETGASQVSASDGIANSS